MGKVLDFYKGEYKVKSGMFVVSEFDIYDFVNNWDYDDINTNHDFAYWVFPMNEASEFNKGAPVVTREEVNAMRADPDVVELFTSAFEKVLGYYGMTITVNNEGKFEAYWDHENFIYDDPQWWTYAFNHHFVRMTRILTSLKLMGMIEEAKAIFNLIKQEELAYVSLSYWKEAACGPSWGCKLVENKVGENEL